MRVSNRPCRRKTRYATGVSASGDQTSTMPPRTENWPTVRIGFFADITAGASRSIRFIRAENPHQQPESAPRSANLFGCVRSSDKRPRGENNEIRVLLKRSLPECQGPCFPASQRAAKRRSMDRSRMTAATMFRVERFVSPPAVRQNVRSEIPSLKFFSSSSAITDKRTALSAAWRIAAPLPLLLWT